MARLHVLGAGGTHPVPSRQTSAILLETRRSLIFFGCGTGLLRLFDPLYRLLLERHSRALVLLADWRLDHAGGVASLPELLPEVEVVVVRPPRPASGPDPLATLIEPPHGRVLVPEWERAFPQGASVVTPRPGRNRIAGESVQTVPTPQGGWWYRVRDVVFAREGGLPATGRPLLEGARMLVHSAGTGPHDERPWAEAAKVAGEVGVESVLLSDLDPRAEPEDLDALLIEACRVFPRGLIAGDMQVLEVPSGESGEARSGGNAETEGKKDEDEGEGADARPAEAAPAPSEKAPDPAGSEPRREEPGS